MKAMLIAVVCALAVVGSVLPAMALGGGFFSGPVSGNVSGGGSGGDFTGTVSGNTTSGEFTGEFSGLSPLPAGSEEVSGTATVAGTAGTFTGVVSYNGQTQIFRGIFRPFTTASEPLTALVVGLGLLGARLLRRR
jgi:hypothetical protein